MLLPFVVGPTPPLGDYPNHLARLWILSHPDFWLLKSGVIELNPHLTPNFGFELIALPLARVLPFDVVGPVIVALTALGFLAGCLLVARVVRPKYWGFGALVGLFAWHTSLQAGFLSYSLAVALFLWAFASWLEWVRTDRLRNAVAAVVLGTPLGLVHAMGPVLLGVSVAAVLAWRIGWHKVAMRRIVRDALLVVPSGVVFLLLNRPTDPGIGHPFAWNSARGKLTALLSWARTYDAVFDAVWIVAFLLAAVLILRRTPKPRWDGDLLAASLGLWALALAAPLSAMTGTGIDRRFVVPAFALLGLAALPALVAAPPRVIGLLVALVLARQGAIAVSWHGDSRETKSVIAILSQLPERAMLLQCSDESTAGAEAEKRRMVFRHVGHFVTPLRSGVSSTLFGFASQQPIVVDIERLNRAAGAESGSCRQPTWPYLLLEEGAATETGQSYVRLAGTGRWSLWQRVGPATSSSPPS